MKRIRFYVGTQFDAQGEAINPLDFALTHEAFMRKLVKWAGGATSFAAEGAWEGPQGLTVEKVVIFEVLKETGLHSVEPEAVKLARLIKSMTNQSSVLYTIEALDGGFV